MAFPVSSKRLPAWAYGAIASIPLSILAAFYGQLDAASRIELLLPAIFWIAAFVIISLRRRFTHS